MATEYRDGRAGRPLRIGTRKSKLALWQAEQVQQGLAAAGYAAELVPLSSEGDQVQDQPLQVFGGAGVFTKALDDALLAGQIELAVHSYKDIPTQQPEGLTLGAVLPRADVRDVLVARDGGAFLGGEAPATVATGSNRRRAQWLYAYPHHRCVDIRGNVQTRLQKLHDNDWAATIFAAAGLQRLGLAGQITQYLDWMLPAPAQGAMAVAVRAQDTAQQERLAPLHDPAAALCTQIERDLLNALEGGCSAPLGAHATVEADGAVRLRACLLTLDGAQRLDLDERAPRAEAAALGHRAAQTALARGAGPMLETIERQAQGEAS